MKQWVRLFETDFNLDNPYVVKVYHGSVKPKGDELHPRMFFSSCPRFASDYGPHVKEYLLNVSSFLDSLDPELIEPLLPLYDPYTDTDVKTWSDYEDRSSDTWEIIEDHAEEMVLYSDADGIIIYEGGIKNYLVFNTAVVKPL
jgi:hypothetical protein